MPDPTKSPAAVVRQQADLRILKGEAKGLSKRIDAARRALLPEYRELGKRLAAMKEVVAHGEWLPLLGELGIAHQRASEAIAVHELWWKFGEVAESLTHFLSLASGFKGRTRQARITDGAPDGTPDPQPQVGSEPAETKLPVPGSLAPDVGDAAEELPAGAIQDPDGNLLPPGAKDAWETALGVEGALEPLRAACKAVDAFAATPAGAYVDAQHIKTRIRAAAVQLKCKVLTPENTFRCDGHQGHGCPGNETCSKCAGKGLIPKPLKGDLGPKPKKPWRGRRN